MSRKSDLKSIVPLTPRQRLARGLRYTAVGPVDVTRGVVGLGVDSTQSTAAALRNRYRSGQLRKELAAAQETLAALPQTLQTLQTRSAKRRRRPFVVAGVAAAVLAVGGVTFSILRRSTQPEPSTLPPSVEVTPKV
jgi:hypothetical protein